MKSNLMVVVAALLFAGCKSATIEDPGGGGGGGEHPAVVEARASFPRFVELQTHVLSSTCAPNPGVCHNSANYPNLETAGNSITWVGADCNPEIPNPVDGWDACEKQGHVLVADVAGARFASALAWIEKAGPGSWTVHLVDPAPATLRTTVSFEDADGASFYDPPEVVDDEDLDENFSVTVDLVQASADATLSVNTEKAVNRDLADSILATVQGGDPNHNGTFGADSVPTGAIFFPGDLSRSYLWGRITGTVPGSRMPLANAPLTFPAYVAIACWIEGLDEVDSAPEADGIIDYDACDFAAAPIDYTLQ